MRRYLDRIIAEPEFRLEVAGGGYPVANYSQNSPVRAKLHALRLAHSDSRLHLLKGKVGENQDVVINTLAH